MLKLSSYFAVATIASACPSLADSQNNWRFNEATESIGISEYWVPDGFLESLTTWIVSTEYRPGIMISCNKLPIDTPIGLKDLQEGRYGTLNFSVATGNSKIIDLFSGVKWEDRGDSFRQFKTHITVNGIQSIDLEASALIDDDLDGTSVWVFAEYIKQIPFLLSLVSNDFSITVKGPYSDETMYFKPDNATSEWRKFLEICTQIP